MRMEILPKKIVTRLLNASANLVFHMIAITISGPAKKFKISFHENVSLYTVRHFDEEAATIVEKNKTILLKQISQGTLQVVTVE